MRKTFCACKNTTVIPDNTLNVNIPDTTLNVNIPIIKRTSFIAPVINRDICFVESNVGPEESTTPCDIIDIVSTSDTVYILGITHDNYFVRYDNQNLVLGTFHGPKSLQGNICIHNNRIIVLIYHSGSFIVTGNRPSTTGNNTGIVFTIYHNKIVAFRTIPLSTKFILFGGLQETKSKETKSKETKSREIEREEALYLLNDSSLHRFNPTGSSSWIRTVESEIIDFTTTANCVILLYSNLIFAIDSTRGTDLWSFPIEHAKYCTGYGSHLYIVTDDGKISTIIHGVTTVNTFTITSIVNCPLQIISIATTNNNGYVIGTKNSVHIFTNKDVLISTIEHSQTLKLPHHCNSAVQIIIDAITNTN